MLMPVTIIHLIILIILTLSIANMLCPRFRFERVLVRGAKNVPN